MPTHNEDIDRMLDLMGIDTAMSSDPEIIEDILVNDMMLGDFAPARTLLAGALDHPIDLAPMFARTIHGIDAKQPAVSEFITAALASGLVASASDAGKREINRSAHHMYVLNELTEKIVEDVEFAAKIQDHLIAQREAFGISRNFIEALETLKQVYHGSMFEPTKIIGMDMVYRARVEDRLAGAMTPEAEKAQIDGLRLNIQEASITDKNAGYADNAIVGAVLAKIPPTAVTLTHDQDRVMLFHLSRRWTSLYETWNLAFCLGNLAYMSVLLPKLLAPAVIDAAPERFLITRSAALWMSTLFHQFATMKKRENVKVPHARELAQLWGSINLKYAEELAVKEDCHELPYYESMLDITMGQIMDAMKGSMMAMPLTPDDQKRLEAVYA